MCIVAPALDAMLNGRAHRWARCADCWTSLQLATKLQGSCAGFAGHRLGWPSIPARLACLPTQQTRMVSTDDPPLSESTNTDPASQAGTLQTGADPALTLNRRRPSRPCVPAPPPCPGLLPVRFHHELRLVDGVWWQCMVYGGWCLVYYHGGWCMVAGGWWLWCMVAQSWWLVAGGWWLASGQSLVYGLWFMVAGGWWLV
jgi:hypothetical protein